MTYPRQGRRLRPMKQKPVKVKKSLYLYALTAVEPMDDVRFCNVIVSRSDGATSKVMRPWKYLDCSDGKQKESIVYAAILLDEWVHP